MAKFYATQIRMGRITIDDVPQRWREDVTKILNNG